MKHRVNSLIVITRTKHRQFVKAILLKDIYRRPPMLLKIHYARNDVPSESILYKRSNSGILDKQKYKVYVQSVHHYPSKLFQHFCSLESTTTQHKGVGARTKRVLALHLLFWEFFFSPFHILYGYQIRNVSICHI